MLGRSLIVIGTTVGAVSARADLEETTVGGCRALLARPSRPGHGPALVFVNGSTPAGNREPFVRRLACGLASAGCLVVVPELPGLHQGALSDATVAATVAVAQELGGRVALAGASAGASIAVLAATEPALAADVSVVAGIAPFADLRRAVRLATVGRYGDDARLRQPRLVEVVGRSLRALDGGPPVERLLANRDPARFDELYAVLPPSVTSAVARLSPIEAVGRLRAPLELVSAPNDPYFPLAESEALVAAAPAGRLTVTSVLDHARPRVSLGDLRELVRFERFVSRVLRLAT